ncbi:GPI-anchored surface protein, putative, partial [Bodo saltans]
MSLLIQGLCIIVLTSCFWGSAAAHLSPVAVLRWLHPSTASLKAEGGVDTIRNSWSLEATTAALQMPRWLLEIAVATMSAWAPTTTAQPPRNIASSELAPPCLHCASIVEAANDAVNAYVERGLLSNARPAELNQDETPDSLHVAIYAVDCSAMDTSASHGAAAFPCGELASFPAVQMSLREGHHRIVQSAPFRGVGDALGIATFIQGKL